MSNNALTALVLAALDDSGLKALEERVTELAEIGFKPMIVEELPETGEENILYLVPQQDPGEDPWYKEYMWLDNQWELIGTTSVDFSDYYTSDDVDNLLANYYTKEEVDTKAVTFKPYPNGFNTTGTTQQFLQSIRNLHLDAGMAYLGTISTSDMPDGIWSNAEVEVYVYPDNIIYCVMRSADVSPYQWECNSYDYRGWEAVDKTANDYTDSALNNYYTKSQTYTKTEINNALASKQNTLTAGSNVDITNNTISVDLSNYLAKDNATSYTPSGNYNPTTKIYVDNKASQAASAAIDDKFFDGVSEDWDQFTTEEKVYKLVSAVEDYVTLDISETYSINAAVGLDPQDEIVSDMYEDEIIDMTNEIIGGNE